MKVTLINYPAYATDLCAEGAAICTRSGNPKRALSIAMESGHESVLEHAAYTFRIEGVSRVLLAQLTRHRIASYSVESQRYCKQDKNGIVMPEMDDGCRYIFEQAAADVLFTYKQLINAGVPEEDARYILPQGIMTNLIVTMNARELRHFFGLRMCQRAQWQIRAMAEEMYRCCMVVTPALFADAGAPCWNGVCKEKKPCGHPSTRAKVLNRD